MSTFVGVDPGLNGHLACIDERGRVVRIAKTPTRQLPNDGGRDYDLRAMARGLFSLPGPVAFALIERQQAYPDPPSCPQCSCVPCRSRPFKGRGGQGTVSAFTTGRGYGLWLALLVAAEIPHEEIGAQAWKKAMGVLPVGHAKQKGRSESAAEARARLDARRSEAKRASVERARGLFPGVRLIPPGCRVESPDLAEALLLAALARAMHANNVATPR